MIATLGAQVTVWVFGSHADRDAQRDPVIVQAVVTSAGPPKVVGDWARTVVASGGTSEWLLIRKPLSGVVTGSAHHHFDAVRGDDGTIESRLK